MLRMSFRKFILAVTLLMAGSGITLLATQAGAWGANQSEVYAIKVIGPDYGESLLIGTMHIGDSRLAQPRDSILDGADRLVVEALSDAKLSISLQNTLSPETFSTLQRTGQLVASPWANDLSPSEISLLHDHLGCVIAREDVNTILRITLVAARPEIAAIAAGLPCSQPGTHSRDDMVLAEAKRRGLRIVPLETAVEGQAQLNAVDDQSFLDLIHTASSNGYTNAIDMIVVAINKGDWDEVTRIAKDVGINRGSPTSWQEKIVLERNVLWLPRLIDALKGGAAVVMVGAAHLVSV